MSVVRSTKEERAVPDFSLSEREFTLDCEFLGVVLFDDGAGFVRVRSVSQAVEGVNYRSL